MASGGGSPGAYRHVILAKLKEDVPIEKLQEKLKLFAILPSIIPGMKSFHWGIDESVLLKHKGYTHVFEATFDSMDDISSYYEHPGHLAFANQVSSVVDDYIVVNYKPISITNQE
ncbi:stress-response A/B barrel domain-containing protein HS1-like [Asparagus officinalis]|uniref:stress-response A/B barrel domain-containing protein HS1-like n=1 Tax=Asparagus officinalis TaxID=4686 RepID=UPI00098DF9D1|nr:stress-response A/B barrel domain-containing protein HS1-like [Asparagus officinalis]